MPLTTTAKLAGWMTLMLLVWAPWAYGSTPPWALIVFDGALLSTLLVFFGGSIFNRRLPDCPKLLVGLSTLLLIQGWLLVGNAQYHYDHANLQFVRNELALHGSWVPGALDAAAPLEPLTRITGLLGLLVLIAHLTRHPVWKDRFLRTIALTGCSIALAGLFQRATMIPLPIWKPEDLSHNLFGPYYYHGNGGAFMNLCLPVVFYFFVKTLNERGAYAPRTMWLAGLMICLMAAVAIASKAAMLITGLLLCILLPTVWTILTRRLRTAWSSNGGRLSIVVVAATSGILPLFGAQRAWERWLALVATENPRLIAWEAALPMLQDGGPWGMGPGNFQLAFPHYTDHLGFRIQGIWEYAHQDYLQTLIEWGWVGFLLWAALVVGGILKAISLLRQPGDVRHWQERLRRWAVLTSILGMLFHALVDFPFQIASLQLYFAIFLGMAWAKQHGSPRTDTLQAIRVCQRISTETTT